MERAVLLSTSRGIGFCLPSEEEVSVLIRLSGSYVRAERPGCLLRYSHSGAGTAGLVTAAATAGLGGRVALIERNRMGDDCLNYGCVPSRGRIRLAPDCERPAGSSFSVNHFRLSPAGSGNRSNSNKIDYRHQTIGANPGPRSSL